MNDCIINKFNGTYNSNLTKLGELDIIIKSVPAADYNASDYQLTLKGASGSGLSIYIDEDAQGSMSAGGSSGLKSYTVPSSGATITFTNGDYVAHITKKYSILTFGASVTAGSKIYLSDNFRPEDVKYLTSVENFRYSNGLFTTLSYFGDTTIKYLTLYNNQSLLGGFSSLYTGTEELSLGYCRNLTDVLSNISHCRVLTSLTLEYTQVSGSLESLASAMVSGESPKTSGRLGIRCNGIITHNGTAVSNNTVRGIYFGSTMSSTTGVNPTEEELAQGWCIRTS